MSGPPVEEPEEVDEGAPAWMATFADLMSLLLTFFVLLLSFANMDIQNFQTALGSVKEAMGVQFEHPGDMMGLTSSVVEMSQRESTDKLNTLEQEVQQIFEQMSKEEGSGAEMEVSIGDRGIVVRIKDFVLFEPGGTVLRKEAHGPLLIIAKVTNGLRLPLWVEGHTDNRPISTPRFPSNWELSAGRATAALVFLNRTGKIPRYRMRIAGYAETRPLRSNTTPQGRAENRRVEFVIQAPMNPDEDTRRELLHRAEYVRRKYNLKRRVRSGGPRDIRPQLVPPLPGIPSVPQPSAGSRGPSW